MIRFVQKCGKPADDSAAALLSQNTGLCLPAARILLSRGIDTPEAARRFLKPDASMLYDPFLLPGMAECVERIREAVEMEEPIVIFGDYDADGTAAAAILYRYLISCGAHVKCRFPDRRTEGYGLNVAAVDEIAQTETMLIITLDCGITNVEEAARAAQYGIDLLIVDHHECPEILPDAYAIVDPKMEGCPYPFRELCGAGLAFKLVCALADTETGLGFVDLAAMATVADVVPLTDENRTIVCMGLRKLRKDPAPGLKALCLALKLNIAAVTSQQLAYTVCPKINAASRVGSAISAFKLLSCAEYDEGCLATAQELMQLNDKRKADEQIIYSQLDAGFDRRLLDEKEVLFLSGQDFTPGVIGIPAAVYAERYNRPVAVLSRSEDICVASVRSIRGVNIYELISPHRDMLLKFGGHPQAAGFTIAAEKLPEFDETVNAEFRKTLGWETLIRTAEYDAVLELSDINEKLIADLRSFGPFGEGNREPVFLLKGCRQAKSAFIGREEAAHLKFTLGGAAGELSCICFGYTEKYRYLSRSSDMLATLSKNDFDGRAQARVSDVKPADYVSAFADYIDFVEVKLAFSLFATLLGLFDGQKGGEPLADMYGLLSAEPFGTAVVFDTLAGARMLGADRRLRELFAADRVALPFENTQVQYNVIAFAGDREAYECHRNKIYVERQQGSAFGMNAIAMHPLYKEYQRLAEDSFADRESIGLVYSCIKKGLLDFASVSRTSGLDVRKTAFCICVLRELDLIDANDYNNMIAKSDPTEKRALTASRIYGITETLARNGA